MTYKSTICRKDYVYVRISQIIELLHTSPLSEEYFLICTCERKNRIPFVFMEDQYGNINLNTIIRGEMAMS